jgi:hypothetical protein
VSLLQTANTVECQGWNTVTRRLCSQLRAALGVEVESEPLLQTVICVSRLAENMVLLALWHDAAAFLNLIWHAATSQEQDAARSNCSCLPHSLVSCAAPHISSRSAATIAACFSLLQTTYLTT